MANQKLEGWGKNEVRQVGCTQLQMPVTLQVASQRRPIYLKENEVFHFPEILKLTCAEGKVLV